MRYGFDVPTRGDTVRAEPVRARRGHEHAELLEQLQRRQQQMRRPVGAWRTSSAPAIRQVTLTVGFRSSHSIFESRAPLIPARRDSS